MKRIHGATLALLLTINTGLVVRAAATPLDQETEGTARMSRFEPPPSALADIAAQTATGQKSSSPGGKLLRNALIGAAAGAALGTWLTYALSDCGGCSSDLPKAALSGAMYGALVGAAIRIRPSRRPSPSYTRMQTTISPRVTKQSKAVAVELRF